MKTNLNRLKALRFTRTIKELLMTDYTAVDPNTETTGYTRPETIPRNHIRGFGLHGCTLSDQTDSAGFPLASFGGSSQNRQCVRFPRRKFAFRICNIGCSYSVRISQFNVTTITSPKLQSALHILLRSFDTHSTRSQQFTVLTSDTQSVTLLSTHNQ